MDNCNRTYKATKNIVFGIISRLVVLVLTFISRSIFVQVLAIDYLGINGIFSDILTMLSMADLGFGSAMAYSFYKPLAENNQKQLSALIHFYRGVYNIIALAVSVVGIGLIPFLDLILNLDQPIPNLIIYYLIFLSNTVISYLFVYKASIITADQKGYITSAYSIYINVFKVIAQLIVLYTMKSYLIYIFLNVIATLLNNLLISRKASRLYPFIRKKELLSKGEKKKIYKNISSIFIYKVSSVLINGTDNILISIIVGTTTVGYYSNYTTLTVNITNFLFIIFTSLTASIGNLVVEQTKEKRYEVFRVIQFTSFWIGAYCTVMLSTLAEDFILIWLGNEYILDEFTFVSILLNFYMIITMQPLWSYREATGLYIKTKYIMLITASLNLILSIIFGIKAGLAGILLASFISKLLTYFWYEPIVLYKEFFCAIPKRYFITHFINFVVTAVGCLVFRYFLISWKNISIGSIVLKAIVITVIFNIIYLIFNIKTSELRYLIKRFVTNKRKI